MYKNIIYDQQKRFFIPIYGLVPDNDDANFLSWSVAAILKSVICA